MTWTNEWKAELRKHKNLILLSLVFLGIATTINYFTGIYVLQTDGLEVPDLILDHVQTFNLDIIFIYGNVLITAILFSYPLFFSVKDFHKVTSQFSLLILVRGIFICFTHLRTPLDAAPICYPWPLSYLDFKNDLFFSGHTAVPFLGFWLFRKEKIRYLFLTFTIIMAATVLLMHVHYSIDVFSAFFITYGTFKMGEKIFKKLNHY